MQLNRAFHKNQGIATYLRKCFIVAVSVILAVSMMPVGGIEAIAAPTDQTQAAQPKSNGLHGSADQNFTEGGSSGSDQPSQFGNQDNLDDGSATPNNSDDSSDNSSSTSDNNGTNGSSEQTASVLDDEAAIAPLSISQSDLDAAIANNTIEGLDPAGATVNLFDYTVANRGVGQSDIFPYGSNDSDKNTNWNNMIASGINNNHALLFGNLTTRTLFNNSNRGGWWNQSGTDDGNLLVQRIVKTTLTDGYPSLNSLQTAGTDLAGRNGSESLAYLFNPSTAVDSAVRTSYTDVKGLFQLDQTTGNYYYDSTKNFAEADVDQAERKFLLWDTSAMRHSTAAGAQHGYFFPFNSGEQVFNYDATTHEVTDAGVVSNDSRANHYFGMTLSVPFRQPVNGKTSATDPMTFSFTGDDDVWVFIDDVLVADLGGMHDKQSLSIDFETGEVTVNGQTHTLKSSFEEAGRGDQFTSGFNENTFASNSAHTLKMFYLERGGWASNLALSFNLQPQLFQQIRKVDQDGNPVQGATFDLYETGANYQVATGASPVLTGITTDAEGYARFALSSGEPFNFSDRYNAATQAGHYYVLRETKAPAGYKSLPTDLQLEFLSDTTMLRVANRYDAGAFASFNSYITGVTGNTYYGQMGAGGGLATAIPGLDPVSEDKQKNGLVVAVPMLKHAIGGQTTWNPLYGNTLDVLQEVKYAAGDLDSEATRNAVRGAALEAALRQAADTAAESWYLSWNETEKRLTGTLLSLPGRPDRYLSQNKGDVSKSDMRMMYCLIEPAALARALGISETAVANLSAEQRYQQLGQAMNNALNQGGDGVQNLLNTIGYTGTNPADRGINVLDISSFSRTFRSVIYIPNEQRELRVWKVDANGNRLDGCVFGLFASEDAARAASGATVSGGVVTGITVNGTSHTPGTEGAEAAGVVGAGVTGLPQEGSVGSSTADNQHGTLVFAPYVANGVGAAQTEWIEADGSDPTGKMMYLKEVSAPEGYAVNQTVIPVVIGKYGIYADAGQANDGVQVLAGVGKLNATMRKYAASPDVNLTLRYITATAQRQESHGDTLNFDEFNSKWTNTDRTMNLEYGKNALVNYGSAEGFTADQIAQGIGYPDAFGNQRPLFVTDEGYIRTAVKQNTDLMNQQRETGGAYAGAEADALTQDLTGLFMIRNTVRVQDQSVPELLVTNRVVTENKAVVAPDESFSFTITAPGKTDGTVTARVMEYKDTQWVPTDATTPIIFTGGRATVSLKNGQGISIPGLPENAQVSVVESEVLSGDTTGDASKKLMTQDQWNAKRTTGFAFRDVALNQETPSTPTAPNERTQSVTHNSASAQTTITWGEGDAAQSYDATAIHFVNQYRVVQTYTPRVEITKTLQNRPFTTSDEFVFALTPAPFSNPNGTVPMPAGATADDKGALTYVKHWKPTQTDIDAAGSTANGVTSYSAHFPIIAGSADSPDPGDVTVFTEPGMYTYLVTEVRPSQGSSIAGISYDPSVYAITIEVTPRTENGVTTGFNIEPTEVRKSAGPSNDEHAYTQIWAQSGTSNANEAYEATNFVNTYNANVIDPVIRGYKNLFGHEGTNADGNLQVDFEFVLEPMGAYQVPDQTIKNQIGDGTALAPDAIAAQLAGYTYSTDFTTANSLAGRQPMPGNATASATQSVTTKADSEGQVQFESLHFDKDQLGSTGDAASELDELGVVYKYQVREKQPTQDGTFDGTPLEGATKIDTNNDGTPDAWNYQGTTYDPSTRTMYYYAHVDAADPADSTAGTVIHVLRYGETPFSGIMENGTQAPGQRFTNTYAATGTFTLSAEKLLNTLDKAGNTDPSREFSAGDHFEFVVSKSDGAPSLMDAEGNPVSRVVIEPTSGKSHQFALGTANFTQADIGKTYTYVLQETVYGQAGMSYDSAIRLIDVTVSDKGDGTLITTATMRVGNDESVPLTNPAKIAWTNTYNPVLTSVGDLEITKKVIVDPNNQQPLTADYHFTVYLTDQAGNPLEGEYVFGLAGATSTVGTVKEGKAEFSLKDSQSMIIKNLPQGTQYTVEEAEANQDCTTTFENVSGTAATNVADARMLVTNDFTSVPPEEFIEFDPAGGTGSVAITKKVAGDQGQTDRSFTFQVHLANADGTPVSGWLNYSRDGKVVAGQLENGTLDIPVAHGQTVIIGAIPVGAHYSVTEVEANQDGYSTKETAAQGVVVENMRSNAHFINTRGDVEGSASSGGSAKTGDTTPFLPIVGIAVGALVALGVSALIRKRRLGNVSRLRS